MRHIARDLRRNPTRSEVLLWEALRGRKFLGLKVRRQHAVGALVLDFYCPELRLAIEVDGGVHRSHEARVNDAERDVLLLHERQIRTIRLSAEDIEQHIHLTLARLEQQIAELPEVPTALRDDEEGVWGEGAFKNPLT